MQLKKYLLLILGISLWFSISAQTPEKAEDINPLLIGEKIPHAILQDGNGQNININALLKNKPSVLVFYRGGWCPYCNKQLSGLVKIEQDIIDMGYQIIAISPNDHKNLQPAQKKDDMNYQLYSDSEGKLIQDMGLAFQTSSKMKSYIAEKDQKGDISPVIPVPAVMVVNTDRQILFEYINPDYKKRISGDMLLAVLKTLVI